MRWAFESSAVAIASAVAVGVVCEEARGDGSEPTYGRITGDLTLAAAAGGAIASGGPRVEGEIRARYLESAGVFVTYEDGSLGGGSADPQRVLAGGLELRPLFLARWLRGLETERPAIDLCIDSIGLELGVTLLQPAGGAFASRSGLEVGLGAEVPLAEGADGAWIGVHGGVRWSDAALASGQVRDALDREGYVAVSIAWHRVVAAHVVDLGDPPPR